MKMKLGLMAALAMGIGLSGAAHAATITANLGIQYFTLAENDADANSNLAVVDIGSGLTNGLPTVNTSAPNNSAKDVTAGGALTWWAPSLNTNVKSTGTGIVSLPYASNMYAPNSTGTSDSSIFETAILTGNFTLASASTVGFLLGSDDDSFLYIDGVLVGSNPGIHSVSSVDFTDALGAGTHSIEIFYADREQTGASLSLNLDANSTGVVITPGGVPEPASWAMMILGVAGVGASMRRSRKMASVAAV